MRTTPASDVAASPIPTRSVRQRYVLAIACWAALLAVCFAVGDALHARGLLPFEDLPPLHGYLRERFLTWQLLPAIGLAVTVTVALPRLAHAARWNRLLWCAWLGTLAWACLLGAADGPRQLAEPLTNRSEYLLVLSTVGDDPLGWLRGFTDNLFSFPTHVAGHPPLPVLVFWLPYALGLPTAAVSSAVCIVLGASATAAVLVTARHLIGEDRARAAAPFLLLAPYALTVATSADAMFLGVAAWGIALFTLASVRHSATLGVGAGLLLGATLFMNYGLLPLGAIVAAVVLLRPSLVAFVGAILGIAVVFGAFAAAGFWWLDGVQATHARWSWGQGSDRPYGYMLFGNFANFAILTGPATASGLALLPRRLTVGSGRWRAGVPGRALELVRSHPRGLVVGAALLGLIVLDLSGTTRLETERIWIPFAPWVMLGTSALPSTSTRGWLITSAAVAVIVQGTVRLVW